MRVCGYSGAAAVLLFGGCALNDKGLNRVPIVIVKLREIAAAKPSPDKCLKRTPGSVFLVPADQRTDIFTWGAKRAFAQLCFDEISHLLRERYGK